jgi:hypothetical protein
VGEDILFKRARQARGVRAVTGVVILLLIFKDTAATRVAKWHIRKYIFL